MPAAKLKLTIEQGATFRKLLTWQTGTPLAPVDLTGCTARMHIRAEVASPDVLHALTTENAGITLGGTAGTLALHIPADATSSIAAGSAVYDLEIVLPSGDVHRLVGGTVTITAEVTR